MVNSVLSDSIRKISATCGKKNKKVNFSRLRSISKKERKKLEMYPERKKFSRITKQKSAPVFNLFGNILGFDFFNFIWHFDYQCR